ncbi:hypothetical protein MZ018_08125 [Shewanella sp. JNE10-2]|uniref:hypothetical protein n=1 Tax=unclassified Shewanella TaxID=196818 RepID=UPI00059ECBA9|nr:MULTISPECIES: hypothetical protein [unclassified Shewanella]MCK7628882.1 hypothetical protein [Shewanella sp. JNE9-1]MCK7634938.1 hypothetical protein [Shewanella sp. JNE17]MCK7644131.1 hypothetical protein [Shewanella sp. JNE3-1]MCK7650139.1 hypothetical protein [Shewanella sp. JNE8]MCK7652230.1 hypothetical protein [Shewanella sp. JNE4-1]
MLLASKDGTGITLLGLTANADITEVYPPLGVAAGHLRSLRERGMVVLVHQTHREMGNGKCQNDVWNVIDHALHDIQASCLSESLTSHPLLNFLQEMLGIIQVALDGLQTTPK